MKPGLPDGQQESLLVVAQRSGQLEARDFTGSSEQQDPTVGLVERNLHLQNVLTMFAHISQIKGMQQAMQTPHRTEIDQRYNGAATQVTERMLAGIGKPVLVAKWEFARAFGLFDIEEVVDTSDAKRMALESFGTFHRQFGPAYRVQERNAMLQKLEHNTKLIQDGVTLANRKAGLRPHKPTEKVAGKEEPQLTAQERLQAIVNDARAGFMPTTNDEKNMVLSFLDYLDNPKYPMGINNQLYEVYYNRANATHLQVEGERAMRSIAYEITDFYKNAHQQIQALAQLRLLINDCPNPFVTLAEEVGDEHPGYAPLVRFLDLEELTKTGSVEGVGGWRQVLKTHSNRDGHSQQRKRKTVEDPYTRSELEPLFAERIASKPYELTVGLMRKAIALAISDQEKRFQFMHQRLTEAAEQTGNKRNFERVRQISRMALHEVA